jgi:hypothetical protein
MTVCAFEGCGRPRSRRGWCEAHYQRWRKYGDPAGLGDPVRYAVGQQCELEGCDRQVRANGLCARHAAAARRALLPSCTVDGCDRRQHNAGLCSMHSERQRKHGDIGPAEPLVNVGSGRSRTTDGYIRVHAPSHPAASEYGWVLEHRLVMWEHLGGFDLSFHVHHKNHDRTDNRIENLELLTPDEHADEHAAERRTVDRQRAVAMYLSGLSTVAVARELGTHPGNVSRMLREAYVPARTSAERRALRLAHEAGE